ncbi:MAG TPA: Rieske 2Fe-2S domain-containing protein, partial [Myxococcota bacterium]
ALSAGVVIDGVLCCPYHGWSYDGAGACVHVPSLGPQQRGSTLDDAQHGVAGLKLRPADVGCLRTFATQEQDGLVYVFLGDDVTRARRPPFRVPHVGDEGWSHYFMVTPFDNGVTNLVENFMDVPHTVFVHQGWFRNPKQQRVPAVVARDEHSVVVTYQQDKDQISGLGFILNPQGKPMVHTDAWYAPNVTRVDYLFGDTSGFVINSQCTPIGPTSSLVYTAISYKLPMGPLSRVVGRALQPLIHWYTRQVITQDTDIMRLQKRGLDNGQRAAPGPIRFASTEADLLHADIELVRRWLVQGAVGTPPSSTSRAIEFWI